MARDPHSGRFLAGTVPTNKGQRMTLAEKREHAKRFKHRAHYHVWTPEEDAFVQEHYAVRGGAWTAKRLGTSTPAVYHRAKFLGVKRDTSAMMRQVFERPGYREAWLRTSEPPRGHGLHGYRPDLGHAVRSMWEANYARLLLHLGCTYDYEPTFIIDDDGTPRRYRPDFYVHQWDQYVEVKGIAFKRHEHSIHAFNLFRLQNPDKDAVLITPEHYRMLRRRFRREVPMWETKRVNIKTHPERFAVRGL